MARYRRMVVPAALATNLAFRGAEGSVTAEIDLGSINTGQEQRDEHIRSADFFEVETYPTMTYKSTGVRVEDGEYILDGDLTLKGVTRSVPLHLELNGFGPDPYGGIRAGFTATGELNRLETRPGDYVWVPPHVAHREENPSPDEQAVLVIARSTQEAIVINVAEL